MPALYLLIVSLHVHLHVMSEVVGSFRPSTVQRCTATCSTVACTYRWTAAQRMLPASSEPLRSVSVSHRILYAKSSLEGQHHGSSHALPHSSSSSSSLRGMQAAHQMALGGCTGTSLQHSPAACSSTGRYQATSFQRSPVACQCSMSLRTSVMLRHSRGDCAACSLYLSGSSSSSSSSSKQAAH